MFFMFYAFISRPSQGVQLVQGSPLNNRMRSKQTNPKSKYLVAGFYDSSIHDHFLQQHVRAIQIEHNVQLTHIAKKLVQRFHQQMNKLQNRKLIFFRIGRHNEKQRRVSAINDLVILIPKTAKEQKQKPFFSLSSLT
jgi:hypothetical protein